MKSGIVDWLAVSSPSCALRVDRRRAAASAAAAIRASG